MKTTHRSYAEDAGDFNRLAHFIVSNNDHLRANSTWPLGRLVDWKFGLYDNKLAIANFCDRNAHLWFDGFGELAGFAISENGDSGFAILLADGYRFLFADMLQWVIDNWSDRGAPLSIEITANQTIEAAVLVHQGFAQTTAFYTERYDLTRQPEQCFPLESGFTIVDMFTQPDYRAQRVLRANAFGGADNLSEDELRRQLKFYNHTHTGPIYHPQCDLCVKAEDGQFVAGCEALIDARNAAADIERVCTHSDFRRRGFAQAVIQECFTRLRAMGLRNAYITGYSPAAIALYRSLDPVAESQSFIYERTAL